MIIAVLVAMLGANSRVRSPNKLCLSIYQEAMSIFNLDIASSFVVYIPPPMRPLEDFLLELGVAKIKLRVLKKQSLRFLNLKPRRSLYKLQLKFVQTTRVVCTDYS